MYAYAVYVVCCGALSVGVLMWPVIRGVPYRILASPQVSVPLIWPATKGAGPLSRGVWQANRNVCVVYCCLLSFVYLFHCACTHM